MLLYMIQSGIYYPIIKISLICVLTPPLLFSTPPTDKTYFSLLSKLQWPQQPFISFSNLISYFLPLSKHSRISTFKKQRDSIPDLVPILNSTFISILFFVVFFHYRLSINGIIEKNMVLNSRTSPRIWSF